MRCKQIQRYLIDSSENEPDNKTKAEIEQHVSSCPKCKEFIENLSWMRKGLKQLQITSPSDQLLQQTRSLCYDALKNRTVVTKNAGRQLIATPTPKFIWVVLFALLALTQILVFPLFSDAPEYQIISIQQVVVLVLLIQNITMLMFSPILLRRFKIRTDYIASFN